MLPFLTRRRRMFEDAYIDPYHYHSGVRTFIVDAIAEMRARPTYVTKEGLAGRILMLFEVCEAPPGVVTDLRAKLLDGVIHKPADPATSAYLEFAAKTAIRRLM